MCQVESQSQLRHQGTPKKTYCLERHRQKAQDAKLRMILSSGRQDEDGQGSLPSRAEDGRGAGVRSCVTQVLSLAALFPFALSMSVVLSEIVQLFQDFRLNVFKVHLYSLYPSYSFILHHYTILLFAHAMDTLNTV